MAYILLWFEVQQMHLQQKQEVRSYENLKKYLLNLGFYYAFANIT